MSRRPAFCESFAPLVGKRPRVLVLGSMPGTASLAAGEYYAHPRNAFWPIMQALVDAGPQLPYATRTRRLTAAGIALWDVLARCEREGSLDTSIDIASEHPNDVAGLIGRHPSVRAVFLNGGKPLAAFRRHVLPRLEAGSADRLHVEQLPSTSPANARLSIQEKIAAWHVLTAWL